VDVTQRPEAFMVVVLCFRKGHKMPGIVKTFKKKVASIAGGKLIELLFENANNSTVLISLLYVPDFSGCSVGSLFRKLAPAVTVNVKAAIAKLRLIIEGFNLYLENESLIYIIGTVIDLEKTLFSSVSSIFLFKLKEYGLFEEISFFSSVLLSSSFLSLNIMINLFIC
jgi:hypothetical protein